MITRFRLLGLAVLLALPLSVATKAQAGAYNSALTRAAGANMTMFDDSREQFLDNDNSGTISPGDVLFGVAEINTTSPPGTNASNSLYIAFSQTFASVIATPGSIAGSTIYSGTFAPTPDATFGSLESILPGFGALNDGAILAVIDRPLGSPFSSQATTADLSTSAGFGGVANWASAILGVEGAIQATFGLGNGNDFFAYETSALDTGNTGSGLPPDYVVNGIAQTETVVTSLQLGNFGAGLSVLDNFNPSTHIYNRVIPSVFDAGASGTFGLNQNYDLAVVNGNFGGILENTATGALVNMADPGANDLNFVNNADAVVNVEVVPEPASMAIWAVLVGVGGVGAARRRRKNS